ncbi:MAG: hypothetical protein JW908_04180 [Anaerolineales bacterium]|nr:hypothetical protein [Anaerolineales bacterium]
MKWNIKAAISTSIAIAIGIIVLIGSFIKIPVLVSLREVFLHWAVILSALALVIGILNLGYVHVRKISTQATGDIYSVILLLSMGLTFLAVGFFGPTGEVSQWLYNNVIFPIEASLLGVIAVVLLYACIRLFRRGITLFSVVFISTTLVVLLGSVSIMGLQIPGLSGSDGIRALLIQIPVVGGARGILIGVALGAMATGLRVLMGADRPYNG